MLRYTEKPGGVTFSARIQPRAAKNQISGVLEVLRRRIAIAWGAASRNKMIHVKGMDAAYLKTVLKTREVE